ncbi:dixin [Sphaerodactylus townsendi]|uniref:dixin n=1 Tax=Sphaerodactylus townsendi TaxID=933632 RepID=UPI0020268D83|nr:dixin [Sphaerodactylus townsendi]
MSATIKRELFNRVMDPQEASCSNGRRQHQLQAYVAWVNSQLKKKPAVKPVQDLRRDLRDGVVLAFLIEIIAGEKLSGVQVSPTSQQEMKENVEKVLQFVASKKIRMHQITAKDIVDGNLKSTMRLILALAAHFKPGSSKAAGQTPSGTMGKSPAGAAAAAVANHRPRSAAAVAQDAMVTLADVRQDVLRSGRDVFRHKQSSNSSMDEDIEHPYWSVRALVQQYEGQQKTPSESRTSSLTSPSPVNSAKSESSATPSEEKAGFDIVREEEAETRTEEAGCPFPLEWQACCPAASLEASWEEQLLEQQDHLEKEMEEAKKMISGLQALLLNGSLPEDEQERLFALCEPTACPEEQLIIIRSQLDQSMEENQELKKELQKHKQEARNLQGMKDALQQRVAQQDALILQLKQELLRANMDKEELHSQHADLQRKVEERNRLLAEYKKELAQKDRHLHQHQAKMDEMLRQLSEASYQQADLERELEHKEALLAQCMKKDAEEVGGASEGLNWGVCVCFLHSKPVLPLRFPHTVGGLSCLLTAARLPFFAELPHSHSTPAMGSSACTKVLYFTDRSLTPFMVNIPKRLGDVTLRDFKTAIDREGTHRYHFKALDPEFGTVKEEVFHDDDIIPGWEGKIVAWVEEDHGEN